MSPALHRDAYRTSLRNGSTRVRTLIAHLFAGSVPNPADLTPKQNKCQK
jgi:hypothetical protein